MKTTSTLVPQDLVAEISPRCIHFGPCGGCALQHLKYPTQVEWKRRFLEEALRKEGVLGPLSPMEVIPMEDPWGYRNKLELTFGQEGEEVTLGFHQRGSFQRIVDVLRCEIAPPGVSDLIGAVKEMANRSGLQSYNPKIHRGFWRYAVIRVSQSSGELMLLLVTNEGSPEPLEEMARLLPRRVPALKSFYWGISTKVSDVASPERTSLLSGSELLEDQVGGIRISIGPTLFVQPNSLLASRVYETIRSKAGLTGREIVYDLYCGAGLIALSLAGQARAVYGVESERGNVTFAEQNAQLNGVTNAVFLWGKTEDLLRGRALFKACPKPDVVVLDPPRAGLHKEVYGPLLETRAPLLLYLSCNPSTLGRDLKVFLSRDSRYRLESIHLFDFFPHTTHMEALSVLRRV